MWHGAHSLSSLETVAASGERSKLALHDVLCLAYHAYMLTRVALAPRSEAWPMAITWTASLLVATATAIFTARSGAAISRRQRSLLYRAGLFVPMVLSYLSLRTVLPALSPTLRDGALLSADRTLFGETPARALQRLTRSKAFVAWLSFFYFGYFIVLALNLFPALLTNTVASRELLVAAMVVSALGHVGYTLVPALGPHATMRFDAPLSGGLWWSIVQRTVSSAGAQLDVFPSLHTAFPSAFALHALAQRRPTRWLEVFVAVNIIVSTMLLRWHYAVDVMAGLCLAALARVVAARSTRRSDGWL